MNHSNRWAEERYPDYKNDVNGAIGFTGLGVDYFLAGKADSVVGLLNRHHNGASNAACLDIGCGIGAMHPALVNRVGRLDAVDISGDAIEKASAANPGVHYRSHEPGRLPFDDASFDMAFTVCVMHHVPPRDWPAFVAEAWRVVRPGGLFAVFEHNPINPLTRLAVMRCEFDHDAVLLSPKKVSRLQADQGFAQVERDFLFFVPLRARWAKRVDKALSWLPMGAQYVICGRRRG
jgi:SAM-dependent methyltransferase